MGAIKWQVDGEEGRGEQRGDGVGGVRNDTGRVPPPLVFLAQSVHPQAQAVAPATANTLQNGWPPSKTLSRERPLKVVESLGTCNYTGSLTRHGPDVSTRGQKPDNGKVIGKLQGRSRCKVPNPCHQHPPTHTPFCSVL
ncbi:hypothetical protein C0Q70_00280 [Pomacea canaliculata]|uniref:Uncharacterized protein n=1 Tax=Pomacea canaliculata TaxID=400727 RepID=A0A2T7PWB3_POMCA|nr:hypothetical protein C0Q70_00280 [Pomacea canaliculata]